MHSRSRAFIIMDILLALWLLTLIAGIIGIWYSKLLDLQKNTIKMAKGINLACSLIENIMCDGEFVCPNKIDDFFIDIERIADNEVNGEFIVIKVSWKMLNNIQFIEFTTFI